MGKDNTLVRVNAGSADQLNEIVSFAVKPRLWFDNWQEGKSGLAVARVNESGEVISDVTCQFEPGTRQLS